MPDPALPFDKVTDAYGLAKVHYPEVFGKMDLRQFSQYMNRELRTDSYRTGDVGPIMKGAQEASSGLNMMLEPVAKAAGNVGEGIGGLIGAPNVGRSVGESIPRMAADLGLFATGAATLPVGAPLMVAGLGSAGTQTFSETGSTPAALANMATFALAPQAGKLGATAATKFLTPQLEKYLGRSLPALTEGLVREGGEQVGLLGAQEAGRQAGSLVQGEGFQPITPESVGREAAYNIPFLPFSVPRLLKGSRIDTSGEKGPQIVPAGFRDLVQDRGPYFQRTSDAVEAIKANLAQQSQQEPSLPPLPIPQTPPPEPPPIESSKTEPTPQPVSPQVDPVSKQPFIGPDLTDPDQIDLALTKAGYVKPPTSRRPTIGPETPPIGNDVHIQQAVQDFADRLGLPKSPQKLLTEGEPPPSEPGIEQSSISSSVKEKPEQIKLSPADTYDLQQQLRSKTVKELRQLRDDHEKDPTTKSDYVIELINGVIAEKSKSMKLSFEYQGETKGIEQLPLPGEVQGKPLAKAKLEFGSQSAADEFVNGLRNKGVEPSVKKGKKGTYEVEWERPQEKVVPKVEGIPEVKTIEPKQVEANLQNLEKQGADVPTLAKAAEVQSKTKAKKGETISDIAARESKLVDIDDEAAIEQAALAQNKEIVKGLQPVKEKGKGKGLQPTKSIPEPLQKPADPQTYLLRVHDFFHRYFTLKGEEGDRRDFLVRNALTLAARLQSQTGNTHLALALTGDPNFYMPKKSPLLDAIIGLNPKKFFKTQDIDSINSLWNFAHENAHHIEQQIADNPGIVNSSPLHEAYLIASESASHLLPTDMVLTMGVLVRHAVPGAEKSFDYRNPEYSSDNPSEFLADYFGLVSLSTTNRQARETMSDYWKFSNANTQNLVGFFLKDLTTTYDAVRAMLKKTLIYSGRSEIGANQVLAHIGEVHDNLVKMMETSSQIDVSKDAFKGIIDRVMTGPMDELPTMGYKKLSKFLNDSSGAKLSKNPPEVDEALKDAEDQILPKAGGERPHPLERFIPMTIFAKLFQGKVPMYKQGVDVVQNSIAIASQLTHKIWDSWIDKNGQWDRKLAESLGKWDSHQQKAFSDVMLWQQVEERKFAPKELTKFLKENHPNLTPEQIEDVSRGQQFSSGIARTAAQVLERKYRNQVAHSIARILQRDLPNQDAFVLNRLGLEMGNMFMDLADTGRETPLDPILVDQKKTELEQRIGNDRAFAESMSHAEKIGPQVMGEVIKLRDKDWYASEVRPGEWLVVWKGTDGKPHSEAARSQKAAQDHLDTLNKEVGKTVEFAKVYNKSDQAEQYQGLSPNIVGIFSRADKIIFDATIERLKAGGADEETLTNFQREYQPGKGAANIFKPPYIKERQLVAGREQLNMMEQTFNYVASVAYGTARAETRHMVDLISNNSQLKVENPWFYNSLKRYSEQMIDSKGSEYTTIKNFIFFNSMAFNLSSNLMNLTQNYMVAAPLMVKYGATVGDAYKRILSATKELAEAHYAGKSISGPYFADEEVGQMVSQLENDRRVDKGFISDQFAADDNISAARRNFEVGEGPLHQAKDVVQNSAYHTMRFARNLYGYSEQFNQRAAGIAAFRYAKEKLGMDYNKAYKFAYDFVGESNFGGGKFNRPEAMNGLGKAFGPAGVMYSLSGYTANLLGVYYSLGKHAILKYKAGEGASQELKALATMGVTQALAGGVMGLPIAGALVAVLDQLFPNAEVKKHLRQAFSSLGGGDDDLAHVLSDISMSGIFNAGPVDIGSRFQLGTFLGVDAYKGISPESLGGPAVGILDNYIKAFQAGAVGDIPNATEKILPAGIRGLYKMLVQGRGQFRDKNGKLIIDPTPAEVAVTVAGFKPKRLNQYYEQQALKLKSDQIEERGRQSLYNNLADELLRGNTGAVRSGLLEAAQEAQDSGNTFDPRQGLSKVVELAQARAIPQDATRTGLRSNAKQVGDIQRLYGGAPPHPSETDLYLQRKAQERSVGIPGAGRIEPQHIREAQAVDQILKMNPTMTVPEAQSLFYRTMSKSGARVQGMLNSAPSVF
jgi:hypothetical protein